MLHGFVKNNRQPGVNDFRCLQIHVKLFFFRKDILRIKILKGLFLFKMPKKSMN